MTVSGYRQTSHGRAFSQDTARPRGRRARTEESRYANQACDCFRYAVALPGKNQFGGVLGQGYAYNCGYEAGLQAGVYVGHGHDDPMVQVANRQNLAEQLQIIWMSLRLRF
jgi:hypothetical protein